MSTEMIIGAFEAIVRETVDGFSYAFLEEHPGFMMMGLDSEEALYNLQELIRDYNEDIMNKFLN